MRVIREPRAEDASALGAVHVRAWQSAYRGLMADDYLDGLSADQRAAGWREALARAPRPKLRRFVAEDDGGRVVGFIVAGPAGGREDSDEGEVLALNVDPDSWGSGFGRALLAAATAHLRELGFGEAILWVHPDNQRARAFYEAAGWIAEDAQRSEEIYGVEVPEVRYRRPLAP